MPSSLAKLQYFLRETSSILLTGRTPPSGSSGSRKRSTSAEDLQQWRVGSASEVVSNHRRKQPQQEQEGIAMVDVSSRYS